MSDEDIEEMLEKLIEDHLAEEFRSQALEWISQRAAAYQALKNLDLI